jgi:hypothetical protein
VEGMGLEDARPCFDPEKASMGGEGMGGRGKAWDAAAARLDFTFSSLLLSLALVALTRSATITRPKSERCTPPLPLDTDCHPLLINLPPSHRTSSSPASSTQDSTAGRPTSAARRCRETTSSSSEARSSGTTTPAACTAGAQAPSQTISLPLSTCTPPYAHSVSPLNHKPS